SLSEVAHKAGVSARYLATIVALLKSRSADGPLQEVLAAWQKLPADVRQEAETRRDCEKLRELVLRLRQAYAPKVGKLEVKGMSQGTQPFILWRNDQIAAMHMRGKSDVDAPAAVEQFCRVFPDEFVVMERAPYYDRESSAKGRLLSAG